MPKRKGWTPKETDEAPTSKLLEGCALSIGQAAIAWNQLHERLRELFCDLFLFEISTHLKASTPASEFETLYYRSIQGLAANAWNSILFDRPKREMMQGCLSALSKQSLRARPKLIDDTIWILRQTTNLEEVRNNLIHSPIGVDYTWHAEDMSDLKPVVIPKIYGGNGRALKLIERDVKEEAAYCRDTAITLNQFAYEIIFALSLTQAQWPERPRLPVRENQTARRGRPRRGVPAVLSPQDRKHYLESYQRLKRGE